MIYLLCLLPFVAVAYGHGECLIQAFRVDLSFSCIGWPNRTVVGDQIYIANLPWQNNVNTAIRPAWQTDESVGKALLRAPDFGDARLVSSHTERQRLIKMISA